MTKLGNISTSADTPFGKVNIANPVSSGSKVLVGAFMTAAGIGAGAFAYNMLKSQLGTEKFQIPGMSEL